MYSLKSPMPQESVIVEDLETKFFAKLILCCASGEEGGYRPLPASAPAPMRLFPAYPIVLIKEESFLYQGSLKINTHDL